jgi:hypothetical protein
MKADNPARHFITAFLIAGAVYFLAYNFIEHRRLRHGPWTLDFTTNAAGIPEVVINQGPLGLTNIQMVFPNERVPEGFLPGDPKSFANPKPVPYPLPFGKCVFMDTTFLPGTLTLNLFNHEIELLPRTMIIDHDEHAWKPGETISLTGQPSVEKPPATNR